MTFYTSPPYAIIEVKRSRFQVTVKMAIAVLLKNVKKLETKPQNGQGTGVLQLRNLAGSVRESGRMKEVTEH